MHNPQYPRIEQIRERLIEDFIASFQIAMCFVYKFMRTLILFVATAMILILATNTAIDLHCDIYIYRNSFICTSLHDVIEYTIDTAKWLYTNYN